MENLSYYRMNAPVVSERELALYAERARVAAERALPSAPRPVVVSTGSLVVVPSAN